MKKTNHLSIMVVIILLVICINERKKKVVKDYVNLNNVFLEKVERETHSQKISKTKKNVKRKKDNIIF